jgi:sulfite exporter TauE/SafE
MPGSLIPRAGAVAARWARQREFREVHYLLVGQVLFGVGWSLIWATALALITIIPITLGLLLMAAGLCVPAVLRWRRTKFTVREPTPPCVCSAEDRPW